MPIYDIVFVFCFFLRVFCLFVFVELLVNKYAWNGVQPMKYKHKSEMTTNRQHGAIRHAPPCLSELSISIACHQKKKHHKRLSYDFYLCLYIKHIEGKFYISRHYTVGMCVQYCIISNRSDLSKQIENGEKKNKTNSQLIVVSFFLFRISSFCLYYAILYK